MAKRQEDEEFVDDELESEDDDDEKEETDGEDNEPGSDEDEPGEDAGGEEEEEQDEDDLATRFAELEGRLATAEKRLEDKDEFIETLKSENKELRGGRRAPRDDQERADPEQDRNKRVDEFVSQQIGRVRRDYPDHVEGMSEDDLRRQIEGSAEYRLFTDNLALAERLDLVTDALIEMRRERQAEAFGADATDQDARRLADLVDGGHITLEEAELLVKSRRDGKENPRSRRPSKQELRRSAPRGNPGKGRGGRSGRPVLSKDEEKVRRALGLTEEEFRAAPKPKKAEGW